MNDSAVFVHDSEWEWNARRAGGALIQPPQGDTISRQIHFIVHFNINVKIKYYINGWAGEV